MSIANMISVFSCSFFSAKLSSLFMVGFGTNSINSVKKIEMSAICAFDL